MLYPPELGDDPLFPRAEDFSIIFKDKKTGKGVITYRSFKKGDDYGQDYRTFCT